MYRPSTGGMSSDNLRKAIISSNSSLFLNKGKVPPIDLHKLEASIQDLVTFFSDCSLGQVLFVGIFNPLFSQTNSLHTHGDALT